MRDERCSPRRWTLLTSTRIPGFLPMADCWLSGAVPALVTSDIHTIDLASGKVERLGLTKFNLFGFDFTADGREIIFSTNDYPLESPHFWRAAREGYVDRAWLCLSVDFSPRDIRWSTRRLAATTISGKSICRMARFCRAWARYSFLQPDTRALLSFRLTAAEFCLHQPVPQ